MQQTILIFTIKIIICFLLSAIIGVERQYHKRNIGLRTIILVSLGSFLFVTFSFPFSNADITRIAAQVVAGIGFLGAGVIIKDGDKIKGLTTAATLWCSAAIGVLTSGGFIIEATIGVALILFTNTGLRRINKFINNQPILLEENGYKLSVTCYEKDQNEISKILQKALKMNDNKIIKQTREDKEGNITRIEILFLPNNRNKSFDYLTQIFTTNKQILSINLLKNNKYKDIEI